MNEKNREEQAAEARMAEMLSAALAEELGDMPKVSITVEELEALERADRQQRRKRRLRYFSMAAAVFFICVVALYALWPETAVPVSADKNTEQRVEEQNGEIIINEGDVEGEVATTVIEELDWGNIGELQKNIPQLIVPDYVPKGYTFVKLVLETYGEDGFYAQYFYTLNKQELRIEQRKYGTEGTNVGAIEGNAEKISTKQGELYLYTTKNDITGVIYTNVGVLKIMGCSEKLQLTKIIESLKLPW